MTLVGKRDYALLVVGLQTGRRLSELAGVSYGDMSVSGERLTVVWRDRRWQDDVRHPAIGGRARWGSISMRCTATQY